MMSAEDENALRIAKYKYSITAKDGAEDSLRKAEKLSFSARFLVSRDTVESLIRVGIQGAIR